MSDKIQTTFTHERITLSTYRENDTAAERVTGTINGHEVQIVHEEGSDKVTVKVDDHMTYTDVEGAKAFIKSGNI